MIIAQRPPDGLILWCPGCEDVHRIHTGADGWTWDGNETAPTITPSILVQGAQWPHDTPFHRPAHPGVQPGGTTRCHSFVRAGRWEFLSDCTHPLAGQTVPVVPLPDYWQEDQ